MNEQKAPKGIEWTRVWGRDGYTWNPTGGCLHGCTWRMPDGSVTECYAKTVAERLAVKAYPEGFTHHYWRPEKLNEPRKVKEGAGIFVGSMADLFGHWVPKEQIGQVLQVMADTPQHIYMTLSKNPLRLAEFIFPKNVWVGVSLPAGHLMSVTGAARALEKYLEAMEQVTATVRFLSIEPLWFDIDPVLKRWLTHDRLPFEWAIIGAASKGSRHYWPPAFMVERVVGRLEKAGIPVFFKGNMDNPHWSLPWRADFPKCEGWDNGHSGNSDELLAGNQIDCPGRG